MTFASIDTQRRDTADSILAKFGAAIEKAEQNASAKFADPAMRKLAASRMALEYAVLATAREKNVSTEMVATALKSVSISQQAEMLKEGAAALSRSYRMDPQVLANAFAGQMASVEMPRGLGSTPEIDKMIDTCRGLVTSIVKDEYADRGRLVGGGVERPLSARAQVLDDALRMGGHDRADKFIGLRSEAMVSPVKTELASRMAFMEATIDASVAKGAISVQNAEMLKERIEAQVFQPRPPQSLQFSKEFTTFFEQRGKGIRSEVMKDVRDVTKSGTVQEITAKLKIVIPALQRTNQPSDHRSQKGMER